MTFASSGSKNPNGAKNTNWTCSVGCLKTHFQWIWASFRYMWTNLQHQAIMRSHLKAYIHHWLPQATPILKKRKEKGNSTSFELYWNTVLDNFPDLKCLYERFKQKSVWVQTGHLYFVGVAYIFGSADKTLLHIPKTTWRSLDQTPGKNPLLFKRTCVWAQGLLPLCNSCHG